MAKRNDPVARARGRKPAPVKKPFPWGFAAGVAVLALFLGGILAYAVVNEGVGDKSSLKYAETQVDDLKVEHGQARGHKDGTLTYPDAKDTPPTGGDHNGVPQSCQVYTEAIANEHAVHSLEHGAVWVTYNPDKVKGGDLDTLKKLVEADPFRMMSPYPGLKSAVSLQAWGEQVFVDSVKDKKVERFLELFTNGPQNQEPGSTCVGTTETGPVAEQQPAPGTTPMPTATAKK